MDQAAWIGNVIARMSALALSLGAPLPLGDIAWLLRCLCCVACGFWRHHALTGWGSYVGGPWLLDTYMHGWLLYECWVHLPLGSLPRYRGCHAPLLPATVVALCLQCYVWGLQHHILVLLWCLVGWRGWPMLDVLATHQKSRCPVAVWFLIQGQLVPRHAQCVHCTILMAGTRM